MPKRNRNRGVTSRPRQIVKPHPDPYLPPQKPKGPLCCPRCAAVYDAGRWQWRAAPHESADRECPACRRIADHCPAHVLRFEGLRDQDLQELMSLVQRIAESEQKEHPLERLMHMRAVDADRGVYEAATTGVHLAQRILVAIARSMRGGFEVRPGEELTVLRRTAKAKEGTA